MTPDFRRLPSPLPRAFDGERAARTLSALEISAGDVLSVPALRKLLQSAAGNSPYLAGLMLKESDFLKVLFAKGPDDLLSALAAEALAAGEEADESQAMRRLRVAKRRAALGIALADIAGLYGLHAVTGALTRIADASVKGALRFLLRTMAQRQDVAPVGEENCGLMVLAMGKHGAFELNYSSDIDLIVFYEDARFPFQNRGEKRGAAVELVKGLLRLLAEPTADGYVFRVDLRLRPDAGSTQIAISTVAAELYYEGMGQNWERAAWIKARQCAGDPDAGGPFLKTMQPFVWRKSLDYAAIEDIHSIKRQIHSHYGHGRIAASGHNIKLGRGGIREIEFFAQTQQLILGGRNPALRAPATLDALERLHAAGHISADAMAELSASYRFLRGVEHRLQMIDDEQTHTLPRTLAGMEHIAAFAGFADAASFEQTLLSHLGNVERHYARLFEREAPLASAAGSLVFTGVEDDAETLATLTRMGFAQPSGIAAVIRGWHHGHIRATRSARAREVLTKLMPALLDALAKTADPHGAFVHFDRFLAGLPAGVQVFSLFLANPRLLELVAGIAGSAPRLADYLGRRPAVLDALIDPDFLARIPSASELQARLDAELKSSPRYEAALDAARRFAAEENFRIGVQVIDGLIDAEHAGLSYAAIAETVIAGLQRAVEQEMVASHGRVPGGAFVTVAQGRLGGREMTAASDLDLVFIYDYGKDAAVSDGPKLLPVSAYFARLSQRLIAALTASTAAGQLYDVDMRLRPSGNQGPVAVSLEGFIAYHANRAWTWEHMALTRARVVSGPEALRAKVERAIRSIFTASTVPAATIRADARDMRERLKSQFPGRDPWDVKFASGGLVDIEFIAQTFELMGAPRDAAVLAQNTVQALEKLQHAGMLSNADAEALMAAAQLQQGLLQVLRIALDGPFVSGAAPFSLKQLLARAGEAPDFAALEAHLSETQNRVHAIFETLLPPVRDDQSAGNSSSASGVQER